MSLPKTPNDLLHHAFIEKIRSLGGEMGQLILAYDWAKTSVGAIETWSESLRMAVSLCLFSRFPMLIWWGKDYIKIYNDAYRTMLGTKKHPEALGSRGEEVWSEIWPIIGPMVDSVYYKGKATWSSNQLLEIDRHGFLEESYFTFSYSPIFDENSRIVGVFDTATETTEQVLSERRLKTLHELSTRIKEGQSAEEACIAAALVMKDNRADLPFAMIYLLDENQRQARLVSYTGIDAGLAISPHLINLQNANQNGWPIAEVLESSELKIIENLSSLFPSIPAGPWSTPPHSAIILPIPESGLIRTVGFLIAGISPRLFLNSDYHHFYQLISSHIASAIANASAGELRLENQSLMENIVESIADPFYVLDQSWNVIFANQRASQMLDKKPEEIIGKNIAEIFLQGIGADVYQAMLQAVQNRRASVFEAFSDFLQRWVEINIYPSNRGIAIYFRDIHERKEAAQTIQLAQNALEQEQQRIIAIYESISDAFISLDKDFRLRYINPQGAELLQQVFGRNAENMLGETLWDAIPNSYESSFGEAYRQAMEENKTIKLVDYFAAVDAWFDVHIYPSKEGLSIYFADVSDSKRVEAALRKTESELKMMIDSAKDYAIFSLDYQGIVTQWNTGAERIFGYTEEEILGKDGDVIFTPEDRVRGMPEREREKALTQGYAEDERWHLRKDGSRFYASGMVRPLENEQGILQGFIKVARDMTARKLAES